jgi:predicted small integral membrane protein
MTARVAKLLLVGAFALFHTLIVFNNLTDFESNYQFVRHVLMMDSIFPDSHGQWRALHSPPVHLTFYVAIIAWEVTAAILLWWGSVRLFRTLSAPSGTFQRAKRTGIAALTVSLLLWLTAFLSVGGEWFLMWQSRLWNGQESAFRNFAVGALVLIVLMQGEGDERA